MSILEKFHKYFVCLLLIKASQVALVVKNLPANTGDARDASLIPGLGRCPGVGNGILLQYPCLKNSMNKRSLMGYSPWGCKESDTHITYKY